MGTPNLQLPTKQFLLKETQKLADSCTLDKREIGRKGWNSLAKNPIPSTANHNWERSHNPELLPKEWRGLNPNESPQLLRPVNEIWAPKTSHFESQWGLYPWDPQGNSNLRTVPKGLAGTDSPTQGPSPETADSKCPVFLWKRPT